ncbi:uncharacterized protein EAF02_003448 [Botrytis sinoallii]|uniref:uncharacterized protein n=1 Tax=Botrytis sinoallii TaxID=1463999 RepID=UPI00190057E1|nr:uncharacterized protein EAF02_003448 [Botrytis sinoallii]KAF7886801.1 hypothetical protein EAF02_003448 [Botrytis sinoallii]
MYDSIFHLDGAVEEIHQIQANLTSFGVEELDVKLKKQLENSLCEWSLARDDQTGRAELGLGEPLDTIQNYIIKVDYLLWSNSSNSSKHLPESEQEGSTSPRSTKQKHREDKAHEQKSPVDKMNSYVLFLPHPENPKRPRSHPCQPPFTRISKSKLRSFSALFGDLLEQKQNGQLGDDDANIVYDATTNHQPRKCIENQVIYTSGLIHSYYSSFLDGHDEPSALSDDRVWNAFKNGLGLVEEGSDGGLLSKRERMDLNLWVEYTNV